jgi:cytochrome P450
MLQGELCVLETGVGLLLCVYRPYICIFSHMILTLSTETLRKYPPVPLLTRECTKKYTIPGTNVTVEEGMSVVIPVVGIHKDPKYYPDPERFDPSRFSDEVKRKRHHFAYLPFGEGPRICIGK